MAITKSIGIAVAIASTYGAVVSMTAISNASSAVATLGAGHGVVVGDLLEVTSGWDLLTRRVVRASVVATNDITFEGINTTNTSLFPAGAGTGSIRRITAWTPVTQVTSNLAVTGGEQNYADITTVADAVQKQLPTTRSPYKVSIPVFDDPAAAWYPIARGIAETSDVAALRMVYPNGSRMVGSAYMSLQLIPTIEDSTLRGLLEATFEAMPTRYAT